MNRPAAAETKNWHMGSQRQVGKHPSRGGMGRKSYDMSSNASEAARCERGQTDARERLHRVVPAG